MPHPVRSAVGFMVDAGWVMIVVDAIGDWWHRYLRPLHVPYGPIASGLMPSASKKYLDQKEVFFSVSR
jgi:hypothetical protein